MSPTSPAEKTKSADDAQPKAMHDSLCSALLLLLQTVSSSNMPHSTQVARYSCTHLYKGVSWQSFSFVRSQTRMAKLRRKMSCNLPPDSDSHKTVPCCQQEQLSPRHPPLSQASGHLTLCQPVQRSAAGLKPPDSSQADHCSVPGQTHQQVPAKFMLRYRRYTERRHWES